MFKDPEILIVKLEAHLMHVKAIVNHDIFQTVRDIDRLCIIEDEINLMLALIEGAKES